jgi:hypothetical protein
VLELCLRFLVGGVIVSAFAIVGDALKPKSFAGLIGAAPSVALATVSLTVLKEGHAYAADEARSMILGAIAFLICALVVSSLLLKLKSSTLPAAGFGLVLWFAIAGTMWYVLRS